MCYHQYTHFQSCRSHIPIHTHICPNNVTDDPTRVIFCSNYETFQIWLNEACPFCTQKTSSISNCTMSVAKQAYPSPRQTISPCCDSLRRWNEGRLRSSFWEQSVWKWSWQGSNARGHRYANDMKRNEEDCKLWSIGVSTVCSNIAFRPCIAQGDLVTLNKQDTSICCGYKMKEHDPLERC